MNQPLSNEWQEPVHKAMQKARAKGLPPAKNFLGHVDGYVDVEGYKFPVTFDVYGRIDEHFRGSREEPEESGGVVVESVYIGTEEVTNIFDDYGIYQIQVAIEDME